MDIQEIQRRVELLKKVTQQKTVLISQVAKELKVRQTDLMIFIEDNPKLFHTEPVWSYRKESRYERTPFGGKTKSTWTVQDKCKGLGISEAFLSAEDNWKTEEYAAAMKKKYAKTVWVSGWDNYGTIEGLYVRRENPSACRKQEHLWRNTEEKIRKLQKLGILTQDTFYIGGAFDCTKHDIDTAITEDGISKAESLGWTIIRPDIKK